MLLEVNGCLGGIWTAGLLTWIIDSADKPGVMCEIIKRLDERGARTFRTKGGQCFAYDIEEMKRLLEEMTMEAGVQIRFHTRVVAAMRDASGRQIAHVVTESKSGREAWAADCFVDATGDGDLAAQAGCGFELGRPGTRECQPMSLLALLTGIKAAEIAPFIGGGLQAPKTQLLNEFHRAGISPSYAAPTLFRIRDDLFTFMGNHEYGFSALDAGQITEATLRGRAEIHRLVAALRSLGAPWSGLRIVATADQIGIREGRRIHGHYTIQAEDLINGVRHEDAICHATFGMDIHSTNPTHSKSYDSANRAKTQPYDIPLRALIARDIDNLLLAGRCISGDFFSHASYRVTGNAAAMGQAAGTTAALSARRGVAPIHLEWADVKEANALINRFPFANPVPI